MLKTRTNAPEADTGQTKLSAGEITDKRGYADRWQFSIRKVDNLLSAGLPHLKIGKRRVRILVPEADAWMREQFSTQRRGKFNGDAGQRKTP